MDMMNGIGIHQNINHSNTGQVQNEYHFCTNTGIYLGALYFPSDGQYMVDAKTLNIITKALGIRWRIIQPRQK